MQLQWGDILLNYDPQVVEAVDVATVDMLQSKAPVVSDNDRKLIADNFKNGSLFPLLKDQALRRKVERAVYRQGPILTMRTFAEDIRVLSKKIFTPLHPLLGRMDGNKTIRAEVLQRFEQMHMLDHPTAMGPTDAKRKFAGRCSERLFLQLLRTKSPKALTEDDLKDVADEEYSRDSGGSTSIEGDGEELAVKQRHGSDLFDHQSAASALLPTVLRRPLACSRSVDAVFMLRHITSIFLYGTPASPLPTPSPATSVIASRRTALYPSDHQPTTAISQQSLHAFSESCDLSPSGSECAWSDSAELVVGRRNLEPRLMNFVDFKSACGSIISECHASTISTTSSQYTQKRVLALNESSTQPQERKRPCRTPTATIRSSKPTSFASAGLVSSQRSESGSISSSPLSIVTVETEQIYPARASEPATPASSLDEAECGRQDSVSASNYSSSYDPPWSPMMRKDDGSSLGKDAAMYNEVVQTQARQTYKDAQNTASVIDSPHDSDPVPVRSPLRNSLSQINGSIQRPRENEQETVKFTLSGQEAIFYVSVRTEEAVRGFIASQIAVDKQSEFLYTTKYDNGELCEAPSQEHLLAKWNKLCTVVVRSKHGHFASTQHPNIVK